jgi:hypothetical protein
VVTGHFSSCPGLHTVHTACARESYSAVNGSRTPRYPRWARPRHPQTDWRLRLKAQLFRSIVNGRVTSEGGGDAHLLRDGAMLPAGCGWCVQRWQR